jgi:hypothetical protein
MQTSKTYKPTTLDIVTKLQIVAITVGLIIFPTCLKDLPAPPLEDETTDYLVDLTPISKLPSDLYESSGLVICSPNKLWSHNDSGNDNKIFCFNTSGAMLRTISISNALNIDWEDLAVDNQGRFYICDTGNNNNSRRDLAIHRIPNPETFSTNSISSELISYSFEDQTTFPPPSNNRNFDVEAVIWHNDSLFLFTKDRSSPFTGFTKMYKLPAKPGNHKAKFAGSAYLGNTTPSARVTAADFHPASGRLVLLVQERIIMFTNFQGSNFLNGKVTNFTFKSTPGQVEALFFEDENTLIITEEGAGGTTGWIYRTELPSTES